MQSYFGLLLCLLLVFISFYRCRLDMHTMPLLIKSRNLWIIATIDTNFQVNANVHVTLKVVLLSILGILRYKIAYAHNYNIGTYVNRY